MGSRRSVLEGSRIAVVTTDIFVYTQIGQVKVGTAERLAFGNVHGRIEIEQIARRAMGLVAGLRTTGVRPFGPGNSEIIQQHLCYCLSVVADHSGYNFRIALAQ